MTSTDEKNTPQHKPFTMLSTLFILLILGMLDLQATASMEPSIATIYFDDNCTLGGAPLLEAGKVPGLRYSIKPFLEDLIIYSDYDCTQQATLVLATHCGHIGDGPPWSPVDCVVVV